MDIAFFLDDNNAEIVGKIRQAIGLYIVGQKLLPLSYSNYKRCGAAGTKETQGVGGEGGNKSSSFASRLAMYEANWCTGGEVFAPLTVPRSIHLGWSERAIEATDERDGREEYQKRGQTRLQLREKQYHKALEDAGAKRARGPRAEWFVANLRTIERALKSIGTGVYYDFTRGNMEPMISELKKTTQAKIDTKDGIIEHTHRRSPRLQEVYLDSKNIEELRRAGKKGRAIARALAELR